MTVKKETKTTGSRAFVYEKSLKKNGGSFIEKYIRVERYINRPLASLLVRAVFNTGITPNQLTFFSFLLGMGAAASFFAGKPLFFILGGVLIQLSSIVDCADGMLARSKDMCSDYGSYLDIFLDRICDLFLIAAVGAGLYAASNDISLLILGLVTAALYLLQINLFYITKNFLGSQSRGETGEARALLLFFIFIFAVVNRLDIILYFLFAETVISDLFWFAYFIRLGKKK